jgi:hypothetical protein
MKYIAAMSGIRQVRYQVRLHIYSRNSQDAFFPNITFRVTVLSPDSKRKGVTFGTC